MLSTRILLTAAAVALLTTPCFANSHQPGGSYGGPHGSGVGSPHVGGPSTTIHTYGHPNPTWHDFNHNAPPVRVQPHRNGNSLFPVPNSWRGNVHTFDHQHWSGG